MKSSVPGSVDEYIAAQPENMRTRLEQVRAAIRRAVPAAVEGIGYRMPGYKLNGKPMLYFAGFREHYSLFAASGTFFATLQDELKGYELSKGTVRFPLFEPVPVKLISRIAKLRAAAINSAAKQALQRGAKSAAQADPGRHRAPTRAADFNRPEAPGIPGRKPQPEYPCAGFRRKAPSE